MSTTSTAMTWAEANAIAVDVQRELEPHCEPGRCVIAGSIRRQCSHVNDIEIVCIPKPYDTGLFASGIAPIVDRWEMVKGKMDDRPKYTQRILPGGQKLDLFIATEDNWGVILAIRTGSADWVHRKLATGWRKRGYTSEGGILRRIDAPDVTASIREEADVFRFIGMKWVEPEDRI